MSDYLLQMIEVQASVITDLTEVNKRLLLELEQYRAIEEEDNIILTMMKDIEEGKRLNKNVFCIGRLVFLSNEFWIGLLIQLVVYGVSIGVIYGVMRTRLDYIEKKLDKHNNVAERVYKLEADSSKILEKISVENNRIKDLEEWQTYEQRKE